MIYFAQQDFYVLRIKKIVFLKKRFVDLCANNSAQYDGSNL